MEFRIHFGLIARQTARFEGRLTRAANSLAFLAKTAGKRPKKLIRLNPRAP